MKVLITGGAGFIGHHLTQRFGDVFVLDKLTYAGKRARLYEVPHRILDIADGIPNDIGEVDVIIHTAAETHVDRSLKDSEPFIRTNIKGTEEVLKWMAWQEKRPLLIHFSTDEIYGQAMSKPFTEEAPFKPGNPYSATKVGAEMMCSAYQHTHGLPIIIIRPTNVYGTGQYPEKLIPVMIGKAQSGEPATLYTINGELPKRYWLNVEDLCDAVETLIEKGRVGDIYNISGDEEYTNQQIIGFVESATGKQINYVASDTARRGMDMRYQVDDSKIRALGWSPTRKLQDEMKKLCEESF